MVFPLQVMAGAIRDLSLFWGRKEFWDYKFLERFSTELLHAFRCASSLTAIHGDAGELLDEVLFLVVPREEERHADRGRIFWAEAGQYLSRGDPGNRAPGKFLATT